MDRLIEQVQTGIERALERILLLLRIGSVIGFAAALWFTPWPWKGLIFGPWFLAPVLALLSKRVPDGPDQAAAEAERRRIRDL